MDRASARGRVRQVVHVLKGDSPVRHVARLMQDGDAALAQVEAARSARSNDLFVDASHRQHLFQSRNQRLRTLLGTRPLGVPIGPAVGAHEEILFAKRHRRNVTRSAPLRQAGLALRARPDDARRL
jgi:hypothetical protein